MCLHELAQVFECVERQREREEQEERVGERERQLSRWLYSQGYVNLHFVGECGEFRSSGALSFLIFGRFVSLTDSGKNPQFCSSPFIFFLIV